MATYVKEVDHVHSDSDSSSSVGVLVAIIAFIILGVLFLVLARPFFMARQAGSSINVPDKVDINVNKK